MAGFALNRSRQAAAEDTPAFGGIAERFRRAGDLDRAIALCREGLKKFPNQLSARVTLGWSLLDQGKFDQAQAELEQVLRRAPDNLAAIRGLAELHERTENSVNLSSMDGQSSWPIEPEDSDAALTDLEAVDGPIITGTNGLALDPARLEESIAEAVAFPLVAPPAPRVASFVDPALLDNLHSDLGVAAGSHGVDSIGGAASDVDDVIRALVGDDPPIDLAGSASTSATSTSSSVDAHARHASVAGADDWADLGSLTSSGQIPGTAGTTEFEPAPLVLGAASASVEDDLAGALAELEGASIGDAAMLVEETDQIGVAAFADAPSGDAEARELAALEALVSAEIGNASELQTVADVPLQAAAAADELDQAIQALVDQPIAASGVSSSDAAPQLIEMAAGADGQGSPDPIVLTDLLEQQMEASALEIEMATPPGTALPLGGLNFESGLSALTIEEPDSEEFIREALAREEQARAELERERLAREEQERAQAAREQLAREEEERAQLAREAEARLQAAREQLAREEEERAQLAREEEARAQAERERLAREEEERAQLAREEEARAQAERERLAREEEERAQLAREEEARAQAERERLAREEEERAQLAREEEARAQAERERLAREEEERAQLAREEEARAQAERERLAREEEERAQLAREEEARAQAERERLAREEEERAQLAREEEARAQAERERLAREEEERAQLAREEEARAQAERERLAREEEERAQLAREEEARAQAERERLAREEEERLAREEEERAQLAREEEARAQAEREQLAREEEERLAREEEERARLAREAEEWAQLEREEEARLQAERERLAREEEEFAQLTREEEAREQAAREQAAREEAERELAAAAAAQSLADMAARSDRAPDSSSSDDQREVEDLDLDGDAPIVWQPATPEIASRPTNGFHYDASAMPTLVMTPAAHASVFSMASEPHRLDTKRSVVALERFLKKIETRRRELASESVA